MWTPDDAAELARIRRAILDSLAAAPEDFDAREPLWMEHDRLRRRRS
jgi:hypothetical protein